jgi:hypothetical protein
MDHRLAKEVVYRFNGHIDLDETQLDPCGELTFKKGTVFRRRGKSWKVMFVEFEPVEPQALLSLKVYLAIAPGKRRSIGDA